MGKLEKNITACVILILSVPMLYFQVVKWHSGNGDNAFLGELVNNIARTGKPINQINASVYDFFTFVGAPVNDVLEMKLDGPDSKTINQFRKHTYLILYLVAPFSFIFPDHILIPLLKVLSFLMFILLVYYFLRSNKIDCCSSLLFSLLVTTHPVWAEGLYGQMYVDRLFLPFGFLLLILLGFKFKNLKFIIISSILCALINDRIGAICGIAILGHVFLHWKDITKEQRKPLMVLAGGLIIFALAIIKGYLRNGDYSSFSSSFNPKTFISLLENYPNFSSNLEVFLLVNFAIFGVFGVFNWKESLIAVGTMLPNIMGNIGGAEKTGWSTHYHMLYFPFLVFAICMGYIRIYKILQAKYPKYNLVLINTFVVFNIFIATYFFPFQGQQERSIVKALKTFPLTRLLVDFPRYFEGGDHYVNMKIRKSIAGIIPENTIVSTSETMFTALYPKREMHIYPAGVDIADYIILPVNNNPNLGPRYIGAINYHGAEAVKRLNFGLIKRMEKLGFNLDDPKIIGGYAILSKKLN